MGRVTLFEVTFGIVFMLSTFRSNSANATDTGSGLAIAGEQLDGESLIRMGQKMNYTLLKLLGQAFVNFEREMDKKVCEIDPCDQWSPWSNCSAKVENAFGFRSRSRVCWLEKQNACNRTGKQTVENENNVCEGVKCPPSYTSYNSPNTCLKFVGVSRNQSAAKNFCKQDGGHLLNTDTEDKWNASVSILSNRVDTAWIDGTRTSVSAMWVFLNGKDPVANGVKSKWLSGEPSNRTAELCRVVGSTSGTYYWFDRECNSTYSFICEV